MNHGVYVSEQATSVGTPVVADTGIPFVVGLAPVQTAENPAKAGVPALCTSWAEAVEKLGYSDDWKKYTLCEFMYSHFKLFGCQPVIFMNVLDTSKAAKVGPREHTVADHKVELSSDTLNDSSLKVEVEVPATVVTTNSGSGAPIEDAGENIGDLAADAGSGADVTVPDDAEDSGITENVTLVKGTDYDTYYDGDKLIVELLSTSTYYGAAALQITSYAVNTAGVTDADIVEGIEGAELCLTSLGIVPDLICAPGYSHKTGVAAVMATKAGSINGLFHAKALIDLDTGASGVRSYSDAYPAKQNGNFVDTDEIVCWPMAKLGGYQFHMSTQLAGLMAQVDTGNEGIPYESPSNKNLQCDGLCLEDGTEVNLTLTQANILNGYGIVTALNFTSGWVAWGNHDACYPANTDVKDYFIPVSRMFGFVGNTIVKTFWSRLDKPMNRRLIDTIIDTANIWLSGLVGSGYLLGARVEMLEAENPLTSLMAGIIKLHIYITPPSPAQEIDFVLEYDASYVQTALMG